MKWPFILATLFLSFPALATDGPAKAALKPLHEEPTSNVIIVNGKKFYSLQNARRFTGSANSPGALMVIHHPRSPETLITHRSTLAAAPAGGSSAMPAAQPSDILSVFAPDEKNAPLPPPVSSPPIHSPPIK